LETVKAGKEFQMLNSDDHANIMLKKNRDPAVMRPDILHQVHSSL
jgi:rRNA small subunit pseudouridine methyltransferase Nep1